MLRLRSIEGAKVALQALKSSNPGLFRTVRDRIAAVRAEPDGKAKGRAFRLADGRTARLATFYDPPATTDVVIVWRIEQGDGGGELHLIAVEHAPKAQSE